MNNSDADKEFLVNAGEETKTVAISAGMGKKVEFDIIFEEAGNQKQDFVVSDGTHSQIFNHSAAVVATPDFYDEALEGLQIKADEIKDLIGQCNDRGISTDYEEPAAFILERFIDYIREDADREYYDIMEYTFEELERIYNEAKGNLEAYLAGEKEALETPKFVTGEIDIDGLTHWAYTEDSDGKEEQRPVFFVGYGHFDEAKEDIPNFKALGVNSFQNEIGTYDIITDRNNVPGYSTKANNFKALYELIEDRQQAKSGKKLLKITSTTPQQNNCYSAIYQGVQVEPGETYEFGGTIKATNANKFWMAMEEWPDSDGRKQLGGTYDWKDVSFEYTVPDNVTIAYFQVFIEDTADEILIDDLWVRKKGTKTNLLSNGDFEGKYEDFGDNKRASVLKANDIIDALKSAEKNDVSMSLLISPHYWPTAVIEDESVKDLSGSLRWMNMKSSEVRQVMEKYLEYLLPEVKKYDSLTNICITNEPTLISSRTEYYQEDFIEYLKGIYDNDLAEYNRINGTSFENFEEIKMPQDTTPSVLLYDWKQFNDALVYEWSSWVAELVNEYLPDIPVHAKIMQNTYEDDASLRIHMLYGSKIENYAEFSDVHGCDAFNYYNPVKQPQKLGNNTNPTTTNALEKTMWYDLLTSVKFMPVYNTEDHIISDSSKTYNHDIALHVGADIWQGGLHGRGNSVIWVWSRKYQDSALANSILTRPDALYEVSRSSLDLNRLSYEAAAIADKAPDIALLWSDTSRVYQNSYMNNLYKAYESSVYNGQKTGFVSEEMIDRLYNYEVVICPNVTNVKEDVARKVAEYASSGRTLVLMGDGCFSADEHNQPLPQEIVQEIYDNSILIETVNDAFKMTSPDNLKKQFADIFDSKGLRRVRVVNTETGLDADQVEFIYTDYNGKLLVNLVLYDWTSDQNVKILVDGEPVTSSLELRSMETCGENIELKSFEPILLEIEEGGVNNEGITLQVGNPVMISNGMRSLIDPQSHDTVPVIVNDRTMLPARAVVEEIGGEVMWNEETRETTLMYNGIELKLTIDSYTAYVNNKEKTLDSAPVIINDRTMLPIRFIAENFNLDVSWDDAGKLVTIIK